MLTEGELGGERGNRHGLHGRVRVLLSERGESCSGMGEV